MMKRKRIVSAIIALCMAAGLVVSPVGSWKVQAETLMDGDFEYEILPDGTVGITGYAGANIGSGDGADRETVVKVPEQIDGRYVTSIGHDVFLNKRDVVEVHIPASVTKLGSSSYTICSNCPMIAAIHVADDNAYFSSADGVLFDKQKTEIIKYPEGKKGAYSIPASVTSIRSHSFSGASGLTGITIPSAVTDIGYGAFFGCKKLTGIELPANITDISGAVFSSCSGLTSITIPSGTTSIGYLSFSECSSLVSVTIPLSVTEIQNAAFYNCTNLKNVYYSGSKEQWEKIKIGKSGLVGIDSSIHTNAPLVNAAIHLSDGTILNASTEDYLYQDLDDGSVEITGYIGSEAILDIPSAIEGKAVTSIGQYAFNGCTDIAEIRIPSSVGVIKSYAFYHSSAEKIKVPSSVSSIGQFAFAACSSLTEIDVDAGNTQYLSDNGVLYNKDKTLLISCPAGKMGQYIVPSGVTSIGEYAFSGCEGLTDLTIPSSVDSIRMAAFAGCKGLTKMELPSGVAMIGQDAFENCMGLEEIKMPSALTYIGDGAFNGCGSLTKIELPFGVTRIGQDVFNGCIKLKEIGIPSSVTELGKKSFYQCTNMAAITLPASIVSIEDDAFGSCDNLKDVYYPGNEDQWYQIAIYSFENSNQPLRAATIHLKNGTTINGSEKDADYKTGVLSAYDLEAKTVRLEGQIYAVTDGFSFQDLTQMISSREPVIATFQNGKITKIERIKEALELNVSIAVNSKPPITLQNNGYLQDCQYVLTKAEIASEYPDSAFYGVKDVGIYVKEIVTSVNTEGFCISRSQEDRDEKTVSIKETVDQKLTFGETKEYESIVYVKNGFTFSEEKLPYQVSASVDTENGVVSGQETMYAYFEHTLQEISLSNARQELDKLKSGDSLLLEKDFQHYLSMEQIDVIESYIYTWLAEMNFAYQYKGNKNVKNQMMNKVGLDPEADFKSGDVRAVTHITADTKYGQKSIEITLNIGKPDSQGNLYPVYTDMHFEILEKDMIPEGLPVKGQIGKTSYTDMGQFIEYVAKANEDSLHSTYRWESLRDEMTAGVFIDKTIIGLIGAENGSFADGVYKVYLQPLFAFKKKVTIACPVNVYVYNMDGKLVGSIVDNQIKLNGRDKAAAVRANDQNITMQVNGDSKTVYLTGDDYYINLQGTDNGSMNYTVEEIANDEINRKVEFLQMQLEKDLQYRGYVFKPLNIDSHLYALQKMDGSDDVVYSNYDSFESIFKRIKGLSLSQANTSMNTNRTVQLNASLIPENASNKNLKWTSDNGSVVSVGSDGLVTAVGTGEARITVATQDGSNLKATCMIVVGKGNTSNSGTGSSPGYIPGGGTGIAPQDPVVKKLYYIVKFDANNGTGLSRKTMTLLNGDSLGILPKVRRENFIFSGWYTQQTGGKKITSETVLDEATTLYAQWAQVSKPEKITSLTLKSIKAGQMKVSYQKANGADGYQIVYSLDRKFISSKTKKASASATAKTLNELKKGKTYYVKVRAYQLDSAGNKVYGEYGAAKSIKTKK